MTDNPSLPDPTFVAPALAQSDAGLLAACRQGQQQAWNELIARYQGLICTIPRRAGLNEDAVLEVFQEVVLALFEKLDTIEQPERLRAWLVTAAKFKTWRAVEKSASGFTQLLATEDTGEYPEIPAQTPLPDEIIIELEEQHLLRAAVMNAGERCRTILTMLFYRDKPALYSEIAAAINVHETSIGPLRARCLKKLARLLKR